MTNHDDKWQRLKCLERTLRPGAIARRSRTYTTLLNELTEGASVLKFDIHQIPDSLRRRRIKKALPLTAPFGRWAIDTTTQELHAFLGRPNAQLQEESNSLRDEVLSALVEADKSLEPLRKRALAKERLRKSLAVLDDLIRQIGEDSTAHALNGLPTAMSQFGEDPKPWVALSSTSDQLPEMRALVEQVWKSQQKRGTLGTPFDDAFIKELAKIWKKRTGHRPPKVVKEAQSHRGTGHLFRRFVERAYADIGQPSVGLEGRIRRVLSAVDL